MMTTNRVTPAEIASIGLCALFVWLPLFGGALRGLANGEYGLHLSDWVTAIAAIVSAIFAGLLWQSTRKLTDITAVQQTLLTRQFIAEHRPRLIMSSVEFVQPMAASDAGPVLRCSLTNTGGSRATMLSGGFKAHVFPKGATPPDSSDLQDSRLVNRSFDVGEVFKFDVISEGTWTDFEAVRSGIRLSEGRSDIVVYKDFILYGTIVYVDDNNVRGMTGVWRSLTGGVSRMTAVNDPDYSFVI